MKEWIRFLERINYLSPWNLYENFQEPLSKRRLTISVSSKLNELLRKQRKELLKEIESWLEDMELETHSGIEQANLGPADYYNRALSDIKEKLNKL